MRLLKDMYSPGNRSDLFDLYEGQTRFINYGSDRRSAEERVVHNGGWFNPKGEQLGWGDLSLEDMARIRDDLLPGEVFLVLKETSWQRLAGTVKESELWNVCWWVIVPGAIYEVRDSEEKVSVDGITYQSTTREKIPEILKSFS